MLSSLSAVTASWTIAIRADLVGAPSQNAAVWWRAHEQAC